MDEIIYYDNILHISDKMIDRCIEEERLSFFNEWYEYIFEYSDGNMEIELANNAKGK